MGCSNKKKNTPSSKGPDLKVTPVAQQKKNNRNKNSTLG